MKLLKAIYHGIQDGVNGNTEHAYLYGIEAPEPNQDILDEITALEMIIERQYLIGVVLEKELENTTDEKKRVALLSKLNTLDKQTLNNRKKLNKLKGMV